MNIASFKTHDEVVISAGGSSVKPDKGIPLCYAKGEGFSVSGTVSGTTSNVDIAFALSNDDENYSSYENIKTGIVNTSFIESFMPDHAKFIKIRATNNGAGSATVTCVLSFHEDLS